MELLNRFWDLLHSKDFLTLSTLVGIHTAAVVFVVFGLIMTVLFFVTVPKAVIDFCWAWLIIAVAVILVRVLALRFYDSQEFIMWGVLAWWNLTFSGITTLVVFVAGRIDDLRHRE